MAPPVYLASMLPRMLELTGERADGWLGTSFVPGAAESQRLWLAGDRRGAAAAIPDEMVLATTLIGTADMVRDRLAAWAASGVDTARLYPAGDTVDERLDTLGRALDLVLSV